MATKVNEPLFHISKRSNVSTLKAIAIRTVAVVFGILLLCVLCSLVSGKKSASDVLSYLISGAFGTERKIWWLLRDTSILLIVSLALIPAFKMKFWNLGGNGQIFVSGLATVACMHLLEGVLPEPVVIVLMVLTAVLAGALFAVIPAIFKARYNTNESLFTLMLNYIAQYLIAFFVLQWSDSGSNTLRPIKFANLPVIGNDYLLIILVAAALTVFMTLYLNKSKQGYELSVVGESQKTAKYIGINVKKVIIRTMIVSGAIMGICGLLIAGAIDHTISESMTKNMGFVAIITTWLAKCNPLMTVLTCFFVQFLTRGMVDVKTKLKFTNDSFADISIALVYFIVIGCEFFITYTIKSPRIKAWLNKVFGPVLRPVSRFLKKIFTPVIEFLKKIFAPVAGFFKSAWTKLNGAVKNLFNKAFKKEKATLEETVGGDE